MSIYLPNMASMSSLAILYHLNAEEEPEGYFYPKDAAFKKQFGPRGVIQSTADGKIEDTGPLNTQRMPTVDRRIPGRC